jgi:addiction module RelE/StbE family toxin
MEILILPKFAKQYKKMPAKIKKLAKEKEKIFRKDPFASSLKTHKLKGELKGFYAFSINYSYRIIFDFENKHTARFYSIGNHDIYI